MTTEQITTEYMTKSIKEIETEFKEKITNKFTTEAHEYNSKIDKIVDMISTPGLGYKNVIQFDSRGYDYIYIYDGICMRGFWAIEEFFEAINFTDYYWAYRVDIGRKHYSLDSSKICFINMKHPEIHGTERQTGLYVRQFMNK
jgi:hypothetical protein